MTRSLHKLLPLLLSIAEAPTHALQVVDARDGVTAEALLSAKEPTRIRIDGAPISDVFGNIHSSNCAAPTPTTGVANTATPAVNPAGEIVLECDRDKGEIYVRPIGNGAKPVNLFISSPHATYTLMLRRSDTPADTIVIRDRSSRGPMAADAGPFTGPLGRSASHVRSLKAMLTAMASDRVPVDVRVEEVNRPVQLWAEARFSLMRVFEGRGLIGERYLLTNVSEQDMVLAEQEFDRADDNVLAVSIETHNLRPAESTSVYVIRLGS
jgi:conjugal transfer pilus assembly protein TraK